MRRRCLRYLDGASRVPSVLREGLDILQEKELHLRTPLEELELLEEAEDQLKAVCAQPSACTPVVLSRSVAC